jgi:hypothetical protein
MPKLRTAPFFAAALAAGALAALSAATGAAAQERTLTFDIRAQSLSGALVEFSRRSGVVIVAPARLVAGRQAPAVHGAFTADAALARLLARSGLEPRRRPGGGLTLVASTPGARTPADDAALSDPTIVVTGQPLGTMTQAYAGALAGVPSATEQIPRWSSALCPSVAGLSAADAQTLIDHLARRAHQVGLTTERSGCERNVVVIFTADSDLVARRILDTRRDLLGYLDSEDTVTAGRQALEDFAATPRAVRWWHVSRLLSADGRPIVSPRTARENPTTMPLATAEPFPSNDAVGRYEGVGAVRSQGTRMRRNTRLDLAFVLIIVDSRRVAGIPQQAVADYLAMAALAQVNPRADMSGFNSVLNLFAEESPDPAMAMTNWDFAYLRSLYEMRGDAGSTRQQNADIARRMAEQVARD